MMKRMAAAALALVTALGLMAGCSGQSSSSAAGASSGPISASADSASEDGGVTELWFYYPTQVGGDLAAGMEEIVAQFNESHPGINVTAVYTGSYKQTAQKAMSDLAAGNGPNVILSGMLDIVDYYNVDQVQDLTSFIESEDEAWRSDFIEGFWGNFEMTDGNLYGLPFQHSVCVLYYNKDMLEAAGVESVPTTWEDILEAEEKLMAYDSSIVPIEFPSDVWVLEALTLSDSGALIASNTETTFDSQPAVDSLDLMDKLIEGGGMINAYASAAEDFVAESCAMTLNTTGNLGFVGNDATFEWDVAMVPVNTEPGFSYGGGGLIMTAGQSEEEQQASWEFMKYMTSPEVSAQWMTVSGYFAVRKSCDDLQSAQDYYAEHPQLQHAAELLQYTTAQWSTDHYWDVYDCMQIALDSVLIDQSATAADALAEAQASAMEILSE